VDDLNTMNKKILPIIRQTNPFRVVFFGGLGYMGPGWLTQNPDAMLLPDDPYVAVEIHNYDPWQYAGGTPTQSSWGSPSDVADLHAWVNSTVAWAARKNRSIYYGEFGVTHSQTAATGRLAW
jgi:endoglucanase